MIAIKLRQAFFAGFLIRIFSLTIGLLVSIFLARILGVEKFGAYSFLLTIVELLTILVLFGTPTLITRAVSSGLAKSDYSEIHSIFKWSRTVSLILGIIAILVFLPILLFWSSRQSIQIHVLGIVIALLIIPFNAFVRQNANLSQATGNIIRFHVFSAISTQIIFLIFLVIFYSFYELLDLSVVFVALLVSTIATYLISNYSNKELFFLIQKNRKSDFHFKEWFRSAIPFLLISGMLILNTRIDIIMLGFIKNSADVGVYRVAQRGAELMLFSVVAMDAIINPVAARAFSNGDKFVLQNTLLRSLWITVGMSMSLLVVYWLFAKKIVMFVFGVDYVSAVVPLLILSIGYSSMSFLGRGGVILSMSHHEKITAVLIGISALLNIILNWVLIPRYGINGAAVATAISVVARIIMEAYLAYSLTGMNTTIFNANKLLSKNR